MKTQYCEYCQALLNDQEGFEDAVGSWNCTECGELVFIDYGDEDEEGGEEPDGFLDDAVELSGNVADLLGAAADLAGSIAAICGTASSNDDEEPGSPYDKGLLMELKELAAGLRPRVEAIAEQGLDSKNLVGRLDEAERALSGLERVADTGRAEEYEARLESTGKQLRSIEKGANKIVNREIHKEAEAVSRVLREDERARRERVDRALRALLTPKNLAIATSVLAFLAVSYVVCPDKLAVFAGHVGAALYTLLQMAASILSALVGAVAGPCGRIAS